MDENLEWLTQKTEDSKSNKGNLTFPTHTVNVIELSGNKKVTTPPFLHQPPPFRIYPLFLAKNFEPPQVTQFLKGPTLLPLKRGGGGGSNYDHSH